MWHARATYEIVTYAREHANYPHSVTANFLSFSRQEGGGSFLSLLQPLCVAKAASVSLHRDS